MKNYEDKTVANVKFKLGFVGVMLWSLVMLSVGSYFGSQSPNNENTFLQPAHAASTSELSRGMIRLDNGHLSGQNLGEFAPYEPEIGDLVARGHETFYSKDGDFGVGIWESKPGTSTYKNLGYDELMYVLEGSFVITDEGGKAETFTAGQGVVLPSGWSGTFAVPEGGVRKIWSAYMGGKKGK